MSYQPVNLWETADNPPDTSFSNEYWGKVDLTIFQGVFVDDPSRPGKKMKMPYEAGMLLPDGSEPRPVVFIKIEITPLAEMKLELKYALLRETIVSKQSEWGTIILPSIRDCGLMTAEALNGKYVRVILTNTGRKYTSDKGEEKNTTTFKFLAVFTNAQECRDDYLKNKGEPPASSVAEGVTPQANTAPSGNGSHERETALKLAKPIVKNAMAKAAGDLDAARVILAASLAKSALLAKYFTVDSDEIVEMMAAEVN